jgi:hypothetical protein
MVWKYFSDHGAWIMNIKDLNISIRANSDLNRDLWSAMVLLKHLTMDGDGDSSLCDVENDDCELKLFTLTPTWIIQSFDRQWHFWSVNKPPRRPPTLQVRSIVGIYSIYRSMAAGEYSSLMSIMAMASHGRRVSLLSCCLRGGGVWRWILERRQGRFGKFWSFVNHQTSGLSSDNPIVEKPTGMVCRLPLRRRSSIPVSE